MLSLSQYLKEQFQLSASDIEKFSSGFEKRTLKKNQYFLRAGNRCREIAFINQGVMRNYYIDPDGNEVVNYMTSDSDFNTVYSSFIDQSICNESIKAVTDCELSVINYQTFFKLRSESDSFVKMVDQLVAAGLECKEMRLRSYLYEDAQRRYENLLLNQPKIVQYSPLHYVASYIGVSRETLSRIRNRRVVNA